MSAVHQDPRVPAREDCVIRYLIDKWAKEIPDTVYAIFEDGDTWTYKELRDEVISVAAGLAKRGVCQGDHVAVWLFGGREGILTFFAINYLGAVFVPFNTAYKGGLLEHVLHNSDAKLLVSHRDLVPRLADVNTADLSAVIAVGGDVQSSPLPCEAFEQLVDQSNELPALQHPIEPWNNQSIIYTSGTTGPSKGVLSSYLHLFTNAGPETWHFVNGEDRFLINMPLFHIGGMGIISVMLARGGSIAVMETFDTERFWPFVRETKTSAAFLLGVMATFLLKQPPSPDDQNHSLRLAFMVPMTEAAGDLHTRFGMDIYTIFNMTEISSPIVSDPNPTSRGTCGKKREGVDVRLVDENDCEVAIGNVGEMLVRTDRPWGMNSGYYKNPAATSEAWRNGWFHTGDCFRQDDEGYYYFVDRRKDAIRRRGENISSFEVEAEVVAYPEVREAAAYGVPSALSEDDVMICVAAVEGRSIDPAELTQFLIERMAYFMVPRYIRIMDELPKTPSAKVLKHLLRAEAITNDTWDREKAGIKVKRETLGN
ncbi:MAG: crotonobetaine/carnitine-CoA ligase [Glaciecola sp.]|uniref:AMP-binding protein n=1 Tax=Congregibacter sp. TaxID=2744308 RepID=UPI0039E5F556